MLTCQHCKRSFTRPRAHGPAPLYCSASCRQRAFEIRRLERLMAIERAANDLIDAAIAKGPTNEYWMRLIKALDRPLIDGHAERPQFLGSVEDERKME